MHSTSRAATLAPSPAASESLCVWPRLVSSRDPERSPSNRRLPALDGLRGIAILLVLLRHSIAGTETSSHLWSALLIPLRLSWSGVDLFFVLSGFLIGGILLDVRSSPKYYRTFYIRRAFRILPVYGVFLGTYLGRHLLLQFLPQHAAEASPLPIPWFSFLTFTHNFWMVAFGWFGPMAIAPTWSLAVEEQFYTTIPVLVRNVRRSSLYVLLGSIILCAPLLRAALPRVIDHGAFADYVLMPCRADSLCLGVLAALLYRNRSFRNLAVRRPGFLWVTVALGFFTIVYLTIFAPDQYQSPMSTWGLSAIAVFYAAVLLTAVVGSPRFGRLLSWRILRRLGSVAYCTYLIHALLIVGARGFLSAHTTLTPAKIWALGGMLGVCAALAVASLSWRYFEQPLLKYGHRFEY